MIRIAQGIFPAVKKPPIVTSWSFLGSTKPWQSFVLSSHLLFHTACFECSSTPLFLSLPASVPLRHFCMSRMRDEEGRSHESLEGSSASERGRAGAQQDVFLPRSHSHIRRADRSTPPSARTAFLNRPIQSNSVAPSTDSGDGRRRRPTIHVTLLVISSWHILPSVIRPTPSLSFPLHLRQSPRVGRRCCHNSL